MNNTEKILEKIKKENIKPIPRWRSSVGEILTWAGYLLFLAFGSISFSVILYTIQQSDFELLKHYGHSTLEFLLVFFPLLWLIILLLFLGASVLSGIKSYRGYKLGYGRWLGFSTLMSLVLGTLLFVYGGGKWFEQTFADKIEMYNSLEEKRIRIWSDPEDGRLSGKITRVEEKSIELSDFQNHRWYINIENAFVAPRVLLEEGEFIKINGSRESDDHFRATDLRPWGHFGGNQKKSGKVKDF